MYGRHTLSLATAIIINKKEKMLELFYQYLLTCGRNPETDPITALTCSSTPSSLFKSGSSWETLRNESIQLEKSLPDDYWSLHWFKCQQSSSVFFFFYDVVEISEQQHELMAWSKNTNMKNVFLSEIVWAKFPVNNFPL